ncbi:MAG: pectate lyase [Candidatus Cryptobacteroides sp.]
MKLKGPSERVKNAVNGGMAWFEANKILGYKYIHADGDAYIIPHTDAKPLWARFYDFEECKPFFCGRDGIMRRNLSEIEQERRGGYGWYTELPGTLYKKYAEWSAKYDPAQ